MVLFLLVELILLAGSFVAWFFSQDFLSIGFYIYHIYPMVIGVLALTRKKWAKRKANDSLKAVVLLLPFGLWAYGVYWIFEYQQYLYL